MLTDRKVEELKSELKSAFGEFYELAGGKNYRYYHLCRVHRYAKKLMETEEIKHEEFDEEVVEVASLFHDIGRAEDIEDGYLNPMETHEGHAETGAEKVEEHVKDVLEEDQLEKVKEIIRNHHSEPETVEGRILQDADSLGLFGVLDIWRSVHYSSEKERTLKEAIEYFWEEQAGRLEERLEELHFDVSREIAEKRLSDYKETVKKIEAEHQGEDIL